MTVTETLGRFVADLSAGTIPPEVDEKARACIVNGYGIALGSIGTPYAPVARAAALAMDEGAPGVATMLADGRKASIAGAQLANAALFHGRAQEDSCGAAHFGAILIPLLTALTEARGYPLDRFIPALVAGYEAGGLLEKAYARNTTPAGLRATTSYGAIAAAAACARLFALDAERTAAAIANAASFSGGLLQSFADGTDEWRYQVGMTGRTGLVAAELARAGSVSAPRAIEGRAGLVAALARTECDADALAGKLGQEWNTMRVAFKPFPVCAFNQTPVTCALALREEIAGAEIEAVEVRMNPYETGYAGMDATGPFSTISGTLMSIPFCIASTFAKGTPTMAHMTTYDDGAVNALESRVTLVSDATIPVLSCRIAVRLADGRTVERYQHMEPADYSYGIGEVTAMVRRIGAEVGIDGAVYDRLEAFARGLPAGDIATPIGCFENLPPMRAVA